VAQLDQINRDCMSRLLIPKIARHMYERAQLAFYPDACREKTVQRMPALMTKGAGLGQRRVQEHPPELQATIQAKRIPPRNSNTGNVG
jgi:hypothetical protein